MSYNLMNMDSPLQHIRDTQEQFRRLHNTAVRRRFWDRLTGQEHTLLDLYAVQKQVKVQNRTHGGIRLVPIEKIRGSANRTHDFDIDFRPLKEYTKERWINIALAHSRDQGLPPVDLVELGDVYFVNDGHHRISVAKMLGQREIEAEVVVWHKATQEEGSQETEAVTTGETVCQ